MSGFAPGDVVVKVAFEHTTCTRHKAGLDSRPPTARLKTGNHYTVAAVRPGPFKTCDGPGLVLVEVQAQSPNGFCAGNFRKIDKSDEGFAAWMRSLRPIKVKGRVEA